MSLTVTIDGTDYASNRVRLRATGDQGIAGLTSAADGTGSQGGIILDDPLGEVELRAWMPVVVEESECVDAPRLFTGYIGTFTERRGKYKTGPGRELDITVNDQNVLLSHRLLTGGDTVRPAETDDERLDWLINSDYLDGIVFDTGFINGAGRDFDPFNYHGYKPADVLSDLSAPRGQTFFAFYDQVAEQVGLFFDAPTVTTYTSPLTISNVPGDYGDIDDPDTTCFQPYLDGERAVSGEDINGNIRFVFTGGVVYRTRSATVAEFFPDPLGSRGVNIENTRVGKRTTAITLAERILEADSEELIVVSCSVRLPRAKVGLIDAGMRLGVRFQHLSGFTTLSYVRVEQKVLVQTEGTRAYYDVSLILSNRGTPGTGGGLGTGTGSTDGFPIGPPATPVHWWSDAFTVLGDNLVGDPSGESPTAATLVADQVYTYHVSVAWDAISYAHVLQLGGAPGVLDFDFTDMPDGAGSYTFDGTFTAPDAGHLSNPYHFFGAAAQGPHGHDPVGSVSIWIDPLGWDTGETPSPPAAGQPVTDETPTPTPDGVETVFTTLYGYALSSLHVEMNGVELDSGVDFTETNNVTGTFTFTRPPSANAQLVVWYQGQ